MFGQAPLNAWWNSLLMRVFGIGWRAPHIASALETAGAAWLIADYVFRRSQATCRAAVAIAVAVLLGMNDVVVWYATLGQAYGMCMLLGALSFRFGVAAVEGPWWLGSLAGFTAGASACSSLLSAPLGPVLFVWLAIQTRGRRVAAYILGAVLGLTPVIWYLIKAPHQFLFDVVGFHVRFRHADWNDWMAHDISILTAWVDSGFGLMLVVLAVAGAVAGRKRRDIVLATWLTGVSCVYLASTHPTFPQYFIVMMPFAAVLASAALQELFSRYPYRWPLVGIAVVTILGLGHDIWDERADMSWYEVAPVAKAVEDAKPDPKPLFADEHIYLLTGIIPPFGMEWGSSHKIEIPLDQARPLHVLPQSELDKEVKRGDFGTFETCDEGEIGRLGLDKIYPHKKEIGECFVFTRQ